MENVLDSFSATSEKKYTLASKEKRFANYIIDTIGYYLFAIVIGLVYALFSVETGNEYFLEDEYIDSNPIVDWLFGLALIVVYYTLMEYLLKGKSLGKYITKTRAVTQYNERMDMPTVLKRTLCRLIPFEAFSYLGDSLLGWHDTISDTKVINDIDWQESEYV